MGFEWHLDQLIRRLMNYVQSMFDFACLHEDCFAHAQRPTEVVEVVDDSGCSALT